MGQYYIHTLVPSLCTKNDGSSGPFFCLVERRTVHSHTHAHHVSSKSNYFAPLTIRRNTNNGNARMIKRQFNPFAQHADSVSPPFHHALMPLLQQVTQLIGLDYGVKCSCHCIIPLNTVVWLCTTLRLMSMFCIMGDFYSCDGTLSIPRTFCTHISRTLRPHA